MLNDESISKFRSEVIERTINIEWIMNGIISQHYFHKVLLPFVLEFLYDEYCTFALKRRVLEKIVPDIERQSLQNLNRVNTIRNYFAHCNQVLVDGPDPTGSSAISKVVDPRKLDKGIDFEKLYREFMEIVGQVEEYLAKIYVAKGGFLQKDDDFKKAKS
jgi:hypothetical protein